MDRRLRAALAQADGLIALSRLSDDIPRWAVHNAVRAGTLKRVAPGVYADAAQLINPLRVATCYADGRGALSHTSALMIWGLRIADADEVAHLTTSRRHRLSSCQWFVIHTRTDFELGPPTAVVRDGRWVTTIESALIESWPFVADAEGIGLLLRSLTERRTTTERLTAELARLPHVEGRARLAAVLDRLTRGCRSYLEILGLDHVFVGPGMPVFIRQFPVTVDGGRYYLDVFAEPERVAFELDGAAWHGSRQQREADLRRDAALATQGIMVVRFTYRRLTTEPERVRREVLMILESRRSP
ncbi:MAG: DUF559 domain-containing protein [Hamadaea sp.]|uniref:DUF559 domain-containing protein n=1 Tax=Hamadaea sp. TaxID=2024425 RepID=UPI0017BD4678|nr:DUF559 domain-containing protein [Hamadaea sp.]NUR72048.1 DUF559 domain-containing protein [Hamadaea sp.]NUT17598.1 DUF559 domain-containing protein [Hamadaea sp.]